MPFFHQQTRASFSRPLSDLEIEYTVTWEKEKNRFGLGECLIFVVLSLGKNPVRRGRTPVKLRDELKEGLRVKEMLRR